VLKYVGRVSLEIIVEFLTLTSEMTGVLLNPGEDEKWGFAALKLDIAL